MKNKINWASYGLEFLTVLVGILIAFQLNEYSTSKRQQNTLEEHFRYIKEETDFNKRAVERGKAATEEVLTVVDSVLKLIEAKGDINTINQMAFRILKFDGVYFKRNAYVTLIESGDIRFLKDFELKSATINLYEFYKWTGAIEQIGYDTMSERYYPYLYDHFDLLNGVLQKEQIYYDQEFINALAMCRFALASRITKYGECIEQIEKYETLLSN